MASNPAPLVICHNSWKKRFSNLIHYYYYYNRQLFPSTPAKKSWDYFVIHNGVQKF